MLTPHCSAASGMVVPPSIAPTTRLRRSSEYGFAIHAGLLPAGSLNHIRAAMGIPDSAFPGNALVILVASRGVGGGCAGAWRGRPCNRSGCGRARLNLRRAGVVSALYNITFR